jgi:hypothetical protein
MGERLDRPGRERGNPYLCFHYVFVPFSRQRKPAKGKRQNKVQMDQTSEDEWKRKKLKWVMEESFQEGIE